MSSRTASVLVIGAGGYIGQGVAIAFRRAGYVVYGLLRNEAKAKFLLLHEIIPVIGDATDSSSWKQYVEKSQIIVDCVLDMKDITGVARNVFSIIKNSPEDALLPPRVFIYTSGIMVYGNDERIRDENWPIADTKYAKLRRQVETFTLNAPLSQVTPIVIRPGWVFGHSTSAHGSLFSNPEKLIIKGVHRDRRYSWVHIDDLGDAYVLAAKAGKRVEREIFNIVGYDAPTWKELALKAARLSGFKGEITWEPNTEGDFVDELRDANVVLSPQKAIDLLGWQPRIWGFLENLELYYKTYLAHKQILNADDAPRSFSTS